jgi:hypothetical protein
LDRATAVKFPIGETKDDDVGDPYLQRSEKKLVAVVGGTFNEGTNQKHERDKIGDPNDPDQSE